MPIPHFSYFKLSNTLEHLFFMSYKSLTFIYLFFGINSKETVIINF